MNDEGDRNKNVINDRLENQAFLLKLWLPVIVLLSGILLVGLSFLPYFHHRAEDKAYLRNFGGTLFSVGGFAAGIIDKKR
jgi:hypothetical protein